MSAAQGLVLAIVILMVQFVPAIGWAQQPAAKVQSRDLFDRKVTLQAAGAGQGGNDCGRLQDLDNRRPCHRRQPPASRRSLRRGRGAQRHARNHHRRSAAKSGSRASSGSLRPANEWASSPTTAPWSCTRCRCP